MIKITILPDITHLAGQVIRLTCLRFCKSHEMKVIFLLILASLVVAIGFLTAFIWAVKDGQYEDDYTPSVRILFDDATGKKEEKEQ